jgi:hypothetical protein
MPGRATARGGFGTNGRIGTGANWVREAPRRAALGGKSGADLDWIIKTLAIGTNGTNDMGAYRRNASRWRRRPSQERDFIIAMASASVSAAAAGAFRVELTNNSQSRPGVILT